MRELSKLELIERSINKKFRKAIWNPFIAGVKRYELIKEGDSIAVCLSGGKDSALLAKLLEELKKHHSDMRFELKFLAMNPGYLPDVAEAVKASNEALGISAEYFDTGIFKAVSEVKRGSPCYLCARMRRGYLYSLAKEMGCNKIALGHHFTDVVETVVMGMFYGAQIQTMMPKVRSKNFAGMELIRPLYCVKEEDISAWARYNGLRFIRCACPLTKGLPESGDSKRAEVKKLLNELCEKDPDVSQRIFRAIHRVNLDTVVGYKENDRVRSFLERYDSMPPS